MRQKINQMKKIPAQAYMYLLALALYFWPLAFTFSGSSTSLLFTVITIQSLFVMACNFLIKESWVIAIIIIEAACMLFNVTLFVTSFDLSKYHAPIMLAALIIELLIITISLQGVAIGKPHSRPLRMAGYRLWAARGSSMLNVSSAEIAK